MIDKVMDEKHTISGVMVSTNEADFLPKSMDNIYPHVNELIIIANNCTDNTVEYVKSYDDPMKKIRLYNIPFFQKMDFTIGGIKNFGCELVKSWWTLMLDPDEIIEDKFYDNVHKLIDKGSFDVLAFPRKNYIDGKLTPVYPDWQLRFRRSFCRYAYGVHHELVGWRARINLPTEEEEPGYHILHYKDKVRQNKQNMLYDDLYVHFRHFCRQPEEVFS